MPKNLKEIIIGYNASGAFRAALKNYAILIVDVIDMSTSLETALDEGAICVFGASPDNCQPPVVVNPWKIGFLAGQKALQQKTEVIIIAEPRFGRQSERYHNSRQVISGLQKTGVKIAGLVPNLGAEVAKIIDFKRKVVICVSATGGVAFDAAYQVHQRVAIGTIARTSKMKSNQAAIKAIKRIIDLAQGGSLAIIAASSNSLEDVLAVHYLNQLILGGGYLNT